MPAWSRDAALSAAFWRKNVRLILRELTDEGAAVKSVFNGLVDGQAEKTIASHLNLSHHTVHSHVKRIYRRLNVTSHREMMQLVMSRLTELVPQPSEDPERQETPRTLVL